MKAKRGYAMKNHVINSIITSMQHLLSGEQLHQLYDCLVTQLHSYEISQPKNELSTECLDNQSLLRLFVATKRLENLSEKSISQYIRAVTAFFQIIGKNYADITSLDIKFYLAH